MKKLSLISFGRNDNYNGNYAYRLNMSIASLIESLKIINRLAEVEWVFCDWNSPERSLDYVIERKRPEVEELVRIVEVKVLQADLIQDRPALPLNIALRHAEGTYVLHTDSDAFYTPGHLQVLFSLLDEHFKDYCDVKSSYFAIPRLEIPFEMTQRNPTYEEWTRYLVMNGGHVKENCYPFCEGAMQGLLCTRQMWEEFGGLSENYYGYGLVDTDFILRVGARYPIVNTAGLGLRLHHMGHRSPQLKEDVRYASPKSYVHKTNPNRLEWGTLRGIELTKRPLLEVGSNPIPPAKDLPLESPLFPWEGIDWPSFYHTHKETINQITGCSKVISECETKLDYAGHRLTRMELTSLALILLYARQQRHYATGMVLGPQLEPLLCLMWIYPPMEMYLFSEGAAQDVEIVNRLRIISSFAAGLFNLKNSCRYLYPEAPENFFHRLPSLWPYPSAHDLVVTGLGVESPLPVVELVRLAHSQSMFILGPASTEMKITELEAALIATHERHLVRDFHLFSPRTSSDI
jgi:hypothetical protein